MPKFFFNTRIDDSFVPDPDGVDLRDADQAWTLARVTIMELLREDGRSPKLLNAVLEVTDSDGDTVLEFPFSEVLLELPAGSLSKH